jgi:hypothetical protein
MSSDAAITGESSGIIVQQERFAAAVQRYAAVSGRGLEEELLNQARLFVVDAVKVTPPFSQGSGQGVAAAKRQGEASIERNLGRLFAEKDLVGSRRVTHLFGRDDVAGLPYVVPAPERDANVEQIYRAEKERARGASKLRFSRQRIFVSAKKVRRLARAEKKKVGWLAGGFNRAATRLGATVPAWVRRHGSASPGAVTVDLTGDVLRVVIENSVPYARRVGGMERRIAFALRKRADTMERQIPYLLRKHERLLNQ